jgi:broad specificity phosphatase PhoE
MHIVRLLRHAESEQVAAAKTATEPRFGGRMNHVPLSGDGRADASNAGQRDRARRPKPLGNFSSSAVRARETCELFAGDNNPIIDDRLLELDWGAWEGQPRSLLSTDGTLAAIAAQGRDWRPPDSPDGRQCGESVTMVWERMTAFLIDVATRYPVGAYDAYTHRNAIKVVVGTLWGWQVLDILNNHVEVMTATTIGVTAGELRVLGFNEPL